MISYLQAINVIRTFALNHLQINKFDFEFKEQMQNLATLNEAYPFLYVVPVASYTIVNVNEFDVEIYCVDRLQKDRTNVNYVISDCNQILNDLVLWLEEGQNDIEIVGTATQTPINNDLLDYVGGWVLRVRLQVEKIGLCEIPFEGGEPPVPPVCPSAFIKNSDGSFTAFVPSGDVLVLDDIRVTVFDQDGNVLSVTYPPSNIDIDVTVEIPPCPPIEVNANVINSLDDIVNTGLVTPENPNISAPDATVKNSSNTFTQAIVSNGTFTLADEIYNINLNGVFQTSVTLPSQENNTININL